LNIDRIYVENFLGIQRADLRLSRRVALFCGANGAGKSSLRDAVALALTADLGRVSMKKDAPALIHGDADAAVCEVRNSDGDTFAVSISRSGRIADSQKGRETDPALPYVLDAQRFARLDPTDRRGFLFGLMGVKVQAADVTQRLLARLFADTEPSEADLNRLERVGPLLRAGMDAASREAKAKATEAKGAWKAVAHEQWGSQKAATWRAPAVTFDAAAMERETAALAAAETALAEAQHQLGALDADQRRFAEARSRIEGLRGKAAMLPRVKAKLQHDRASLTEWQQKVDLAQAAAGVAPRVGLIHDLAHAVNYLLSFCSDEIGDAEASDARAALAAYEREHGKLGDVGGDAEARDRLPQLISTRDLMKRSVENDERDIASAEAAGTEIKLLEEQTATPVDAAALEAARQAVAKALAARKDRAEALERLRTAKAAAEAVERRTADAARHHADVIAWDAIGDALAPDGIPADLLREALQPMNDRLAQSAADTDWPLVTIDGDMAIMFGGRSLNLCSESEQWRAGAMLAEAIAHLSGVQLLVLDRVDMLDLHGRAALLGWLDMLAENGELATALLFATLKQRPEQLPAGIEAVWIDNGRAMLNVEREVAEVA
jgi:energy-coupling factor transporter ATP-binding protein EcfA2